MSFAIDSLLFMLDFETFKKFENHDIQAFREEKIRQKMKFLDRAVTKCPETWNRSLREFCLQGKDIPRSGKSSPSQE